MISKKLRLSRRDFISARQSGKSLKLPWASLLISPNASQTSRWAVVTSAKLDKRSVVRNKLRRAIYDSAKTLPGGHDVIVFPNKQAFKLSQLEICRTLKRATENL